MTGKMKMSDLGPAMRSLGLFPTEAEVEEMVREYDNGSGSLEFARFCNIMVDNMKDIHSEAEHKATVDAFRVFDKDNTGRVTVDEMREILSTLGEKLSEAEINDMLKDAPMDGGKIKYEEFTKMLMA
eukprot:TRINITY_DN22039_c0_g1_i1.p3 TRINITY_DN22039_c0_g1~~TRINITY_DN22039_c0_g1_i1.p3  ORF type:complete len:127 (-),score=41.67 TRINITY_DN22039_c0_g1_i1:43-423(-)